MHSVPLPRGCGARDCLLEDKIVKNVFYRKKIVKSGLRQIRSQISILCSIEWLSYIVWEAGWNNTLWKWGPGCSGSPCSLGRADPSPAGMLPPANGAFAGWERRGERFGSFPFASFSPSCYISASFWLHASSSAAEGGKIKTHLYLRWGCAEIGRCSSWKQHHSRSAGLGGTDPGLWSGLYLASTNKLFGCLVSGTLFSKLSKISRLPFFLVHLAALHSFFLHAWPWRNIRWVPQMFSRVLMWKWGNFHLERSRFSPQGTQLGIDRITNGTQDSGLPSQSSLTLSSCSTSVSFLTWGILNWKASWALEVLGKRRLV